MSDRDGARIDARALLSGQERLEIQGRPVLLSHSFAFAVCRSVCAQRFAPPRTTEKCVEDAKQDEKHVPDLLKSIMRPIWSVREELRPILFKMNQFKPEITKIQVGSKS